MAGKIYTKVGDKGQTSLLGGQKVVKSHAKIAAYGTIDELNSFLGFARTAVKDKVLNSDLEKLQHWLFDLGGLLASEAADREKFKLTPITPEHVKFLEKRIDEATKKMPELKEFILPGGSEASSRLHLARTVARRAERCMVESGLESELPDNAVPFVNRVSDYLFVMARYVNHLEGVKDTTWMKSSPA